MQKWLDAAKKEHANMLRIISTYSWQRYRLMVLLLKQFI
jgi:hypothetical protein